jgi:hypothetical protein
MAYVIAEPCIRVKDTVCVDACPVVLASEYTTPADAYTSFKALYEALKEFEADLHQHVHLENNVLFPRAVESETSAPYRV